MVTGALVVFLEATVFLVAGIVSVWGVAQLLGYIASKGREAWPAPRPAGERRRTPSLG